MRKIWIVLCVVVIAAALGACGKSNKNKTAATSTTSEATTTSTTAATAALVTTKTNATLGTILADSQGMTLYTLTSAGKPVACNATCSSVWPPLELPAGVTTPTGAPGVTGLGTTTGPNGTKQVTHGGLPLYRFSRDTASTDASGEGIQSFGGVWHVVKAGAASTVTTIATTPNATASTTSTTSGSGY